MFRSGIIALTASGVTIAADQIIKRASYALPEEGVRLVPGLTFVRFLNPHLAGSLPLPETLVIGGAVAALALVAMALRRSLRAPGAAEVAGWAIIFGGGLSNLGDRLIRGGVLDIVRVGPISYINLADVAILLGIVLILVKSRKRTLTRSGESA